MRFDVELSAILSKFGMRLARVLGLFAVGHCVISTPVILNGGYIYKNSPLFLRNKGDFLGFIGEVLKTL